MAVVDFKTRSPRPSVADQPGRHSITVNDQELELLRLIRACPSREAVLVLLQELAAAKALR